MKMSWDEIVSVTRDRVNSKEITYLCFGKLVEVLQRFRLKIQMVSALHMNSVGESKRTFSRTVFIKVIATSVF